MLAKVIEQRLRKTVVRKLHNKLKCSRKYLAPFRRQPSISQSFQEICHVFADITVYLHGRIGLLT